MKRKNRGDRMKMKQQRKLLHAVPPPPTQPAAPTEAPAVAPITTEVVHVTPEQAAKWLERNHPNNRNVNWRMVEAFANDMRSGAWALTHQGICFDADQRLIDGQHRLHAVVRSECTIPMLVMRTTVGDFHDPIDRVRPRAVSTIMGIAHREVTCLNVLRMMESGFQLHTPMTLNDAEGVRERHEQWLAQASTIPGRTKLTGTVLAAVVWAFPTGNEPRIMDWAMKVASGEMIAKGHPAYAYRLWRERNKKGASSWDGTMAALNCLRYHVTEKSLSSVTLGEAGYRAFCAKRRAQKVPHTPNADLVPGVGWVPSRGEEGGS